MQRCHAAHKNGAKPSIIQRTTMRACWKAACCSSWHAHRLARSVLHNEDFPGGIQKIDIPGQRGNTLTSYQASLLCPGALQTVKRSTYPTRLFLCCPAICHKQGALNMPLHPDWQQREPQRLSATATSMTPRHMGHCRKAEARRARRQRAVSGKHSCCNCIPTSAQHAPGPSIPWWVRLQH